MKDAQEKDVKDKVPGAVVTIQRVIKNPFYVIQATDNQIKILLKMIEDGHPIILYVDATGGVSRAPQGVQKRIYYYTAVLPLPRPREDTTVVFGLTEMISSSHDADTIGAWIRNLKWLASKKTNVWPLIDHCVTDFSYAILNALSDAMNNQSLTEYINMTYNTKILNITTNDKKVTELHICCNHFMNICAKDIDSHFPNSNATIRAVVKECLAMMFNLATIDELEIVYKCLQIVLISKYSNDQVRMALNQLNSLISNDKEKIDNEKDKENGEEEQDEEVEILFYDETIAYETQYESSLFYQHFKKLSNQSTAFERSNVINNFYCPPFASLLLQKYMAILPLWTRINNGGLKRMTNSYVENFFKLLKHKILVPLEIGQLPTKTSRVLKATKIFNDKAMDHFLLRIPTTKNCGNSRPGRVKVKTPKRLGTPKTLGTPKRFGTPKLGRSRGRTPTSVHTPKSRRTPTSPRTPTSVRDPTSRLISTSAVVLLSPHTPTTYQFSSSISATQGSPLDNPLDQPFTEESWRPKRPKHSYFQGNVIRQISSPTTRRLLFQQKKTNIKNIKMKNCLFDNPDLYYATDSTLHSSSI